MDFIKACDSEALHAKNATPLNVYIAKLPSVARGVTFKVHQFVINNLELFLAGVLFAVWSPQVFIITAVLAGAFIAVEKMKKDQIFKGPITQEVGKTKIAIGPTEASLISGVVGVAGLLLRIEFLQQAAAAFVLGQAIYYAVQSSSDGKQSSKQAERPNFDESTNIPETPYSVNSDDQFVGGLEKQYNPED